MDATKTEVDDFLENNEEELRISWRMWHGKFIVEELNSEEHENAVCECVAQLTAAIRRVHVPGMITSLSPSLKAPEGYPNASGKIKPDACVMNRKKKVNKTAVANGLAATDDGRFYPSIVVEVGFSQTEESLQEKVKAWLEAGDDYTGVRCVIEINIKETGRPPDWIKFRVHRRGQARVPRTRKITAQEYAANPNDAGYRKVLMAQDVCYPADVPNGFQDVTLDFGRVYASMPGFDTTDEEEEEAAGESENESEGEGGDNGPREGGFLTNIPHVRSKRLRTG